MVLIERFPFNWRNPFGYLIAASIQCIEVLNSLTFVACMISLGVGAFLFAVAGAKAATIILKEINENAKSKNKNKLENRQRILKQLAAYIQFHWSLKKFSSNFKKFHIVPHKKHQPICFKLQSFFQTCAFVSSSVSTSVYDYVLMELGYDLCCYVNDANGNS